MKKIMLSFVVSLIALGGCASEVLRHPSELLAGSSQGSKWFLLSQSIALTLDSGYARSINAGAEFAEVGTIKQGVVMKPVNTVFTVEGAHMHEAYPVVSNGRIVGFYLPVEKAFSPLSLTVDFPIQQRSP